MKKSKLFSYFASALLIGTLFVSCGGSNNDTGGAFLNPVSNNSLSLGDVAIGTVNGCGSAFDRDQFRSALVNAQFGGTSVSQNFFYTVFEINERNFDFLGFIPTTSSSIRQTGTLTRSIDVSNGVLNHELASSLEGLRDLFINELDSTSFSDYRTLSSNLHQFETASGDVYTIDLCRSLAANPVMISRSSGEFIQLSF